MAFSGNARASFILASSCSNPDACLWSRLGGFSPSLLFYPASSIAPIASTVFPVESPSASVANDALFYSSSSVLHKRLHLFSSPVKSSSPADLHIYFPLVENCYSSLISTALQNSFFLGGDQKKTAFSKAVSPFSSLQSNLQIRLLLGSILTAWSPKSSQFCCHSMRNLWSGTYPSPPINSDKRSTPSSTV